MIVLPEPVGAFITQVRKPPLFRSFLDVDNNFSTDLI
jgi:hypothetical protein